MNLLKFSSIVAFALLVACRADDSKSKTDSTTSAVVVTDTSQKEENALPEASDDEIREFGLLKEVEDSGYPIATLTIEFPERKFSEYFVVNFEEVKGPDINKLRSWVGKYVSFFYKSELKNALMDIRVNGKTIFTGDPIQVSADTEKVVGILSGADEPTPGDLPGTVSITTKDNEVFDFDFFVTEEMVKLNGKKVVAFYEKRPENIITTIKVSK